MHVGSADSSDCCSVRPDELLETIMKYEASINTESMGNVVSDLTASRKNRVFASRTSRRDQGDC